MTNESIETSLGLDPADAVHVSAKEGTGIDELLEKIIEIIPPPEGDPDAPLQALIFDSFFDPYLGAIIKTRIINGTLKKNDTIRLVSTGKDYPVSDVGHFRMKLEKKESLGPGEVGYIVAGIKTVVDTKIGDTVTLASNPCSEPLSGFKEVKPMVFSGLYPMYSDDYENLKEALEKLQLNDASFMNPITPMPWASVSGAVFSASFTWRLSRNALNGNSISPWLPRHPVLSTRSS